MGDDVMRGELPNEMIVCLTIYKLSGGRSGSRSVGYDVLVDSLKDIMSENEISSHVDYLFDLGIINGKWDLRDGVWGRSFFVSGEASGFVESAFARSSLCD